MSHLLVAFALGTLLGGFAAATELPQLVFGRDTLEIGHVLLTTPEPDLMTDPHRNDRLCGDVEGCLSAYTTQEATYRRFRTRDEAAEYARQDETRVQERSIVITFGGSPLSAHERDLIKDVFAGYHSSD